MVYNIIVALLANIMSINIDYHLIFFQQKKPKFMGKDHPMAEASKLGIGAESLFFEKVRALNIVLLQWQELHCVYSVIA